MKLGLGDVAVGFELIERDHSTERVNSMFLVFGEDSGKQYSKYWYDIYIHKAR